MKADPIMLLMHDRAEARKSNDPMVDRCVLGTVNRNGHAALRTLVLRDVDDRLALFYSKSSAKHPEIATNGNRGSLLVVLPSVGVQYRIDARFEEITRSVIESHWQLKPDASKRMDAIYERHPQSTVIDDFDAFETLFAATAPPRQRPPNGVGVFVIPELVERLELLADPQMHERKIYKRLGDEWKMQPLVP